MLICRMLITRPAVLILCGDPIFHLIEENSTQEDVRFGGTNSSLNPQSPQALFLDRKLGRKGRHPAR